MMALRRPVRAEGPLRVLFVVPDLRVGGAERHETTLLAGLDRDRFQPALICIGAEGDAIGAEGEMFSSLTAAGVPARALHRTKRQAPLSLAQLVRAMRRMRPDVVVARSYNAEVLGRIAAILCRVPRSVVWVHHSAEDRPRGFVHRLSDRLLDPATDAYYGVADGQLPFLIDVVGLPPGKIRIVRNGADVSRFATAAASRDQAVAASLGIVPGQAVIGSVAMLRPEKDQATLLRAARLVVDRLPDTRILLVGDGPLRGQLERLAAALGIADNVVFAGVRDDVPQVLSVMDVFALTSTTESSPISVIEAMAAARPVVSTAVGGVSELLVDGISGHLVPAADPVALADRLVGLLLDRELAASMGAAGQRRVASRFSLVDSICAAQNMLEETAGRRPRVDSVDDASGSTTSPNGPVRLPINLSVVLDRTGVGGIEYGLLNLFRSFDPSVVRPRLICLKERGALGDLFRGGGFPLHVVGRSGRYDPRTVPRLVRRFRTDRTDVVMVSAHARASMTLGRVAARLAGVPANIVSVHEMDFVPLGQRCIARHDLETLFLSDALVLLADRQGKYLRMSEGVGSRPWRRIREVVIPNGVPSPALPSAEEITAARAELRLGPSDFVVGIVARLSDAKAHHVLIDAIARLAPARPNVQLVVVGDGPRNAELRHVVAERGIADRVRFTGDRRDVHVLLRLFDVFCLSSDWEAMPLAVLEAMAVGLPVVVTDCGALRDVVTDGIEGYVVAVGDSAAIADRLDRLAVDPALRARLGAAAGARFDKDHCIERMARRYERLLVELTAHAGRRLIRRPPPGGTQGQAAQGRGHG